MQSKNNIEDIFKEYSQLVFKYLMRLTCGNTDISEEITQETFYQAMKNIDKFNNSCKMSTWLCAIAKNQLKVYLRKNPNTEEINENDMIYSSIEQDFLAEENRKLLLKKLHSCCQEPYREVMYLRIFGNLTFKEIGEVVGKTENWARVIYYRGKERLRKEIEENE